MVKIISDSTCDLPPGILEELNITLSPLCISVSGDMEQYRDGVDITPADVFRLSEEENRRCTTSAVNAYDYRRLFEEYAPKYDAVVQICLSGQLSACYGAAIEAAKDFGNVYITDSRSLSAGSGYLVHDAALMAAAGASAREICDMIENDAHYIDTSFVIDRMDYLHRGGRCSGLEVIGARLLGIKPCIEVCGGLMRVGKKYRGKFGTCLSAYVKDRLADRDDIDTKRVFITHSMCAPETVETVRALIAEHAGFERVIETRAGCTVSAHCGPNTLGILFKRKTKVT